MSPEPHQQLPVLIYDGDCSSCTTLARSARKRLPDSVSVLPWQSLPDLARLGLSEADVTSAAYWLDHSGRLYRGHRAVAQTLKHMGTGWRLAGTIVALPPVSWLAAIVYRYVARNRDRLPGGTAACTID